MTSNLEFVKYVCNQISGAGDIDYKMMFGAYSIYCDGKVIGVICENQFFVKKTSAGISILPGCEEAAPYRGAKSHLLIETMDNRELMARFISATCQELPVPKPKKKKKE